MKIRSEVFIGLTALIVSICALFVSVRQSQLMKTQQKAMLYPHLIYTSNYSGSGFKILIKNSGTGLAMIKSVEVNCRGQYFSKWEEIFDFFLPEGHKVGWNIVGSSSIQETVLIPGEEVEIFRTPWNEETRILVDSLEALDFKIQYSSILNDAWQITSDHKIPQKINYKPERRALQFD